MTREDAFILWLASLGIHRPWELLARHGSAEGVFRNGQVPNANTDYLAELVNRTKAAFTGDARFISYKHGDYPKRLATIPDAPLGIFVMGRLPKPDKPAVAIVGARDNTQYGRQAAEMLAGELAAAGVVVVSGMARGLDAKAHSAALAAGGETCAVLPCGVDVCYPAENHKLYRQIPDNGCLVTEHFPGFRPQKWSFPARNRIIAGMADVLVVIEAGAKSGTLTTVDHALAQGKDVFAVPGRITDKKSAGTNELIKQGAHMLTAPEDIFLALKIGHDDAPDEIPQKISLATEEALVYACINYDPASVDYILYKTGLNIADANRILLNIELAGHIKKLPGQKYIKS
ncbi:MAG: DNA-processing protein DprA [Defluviitaleaceae bacterium]|nr:DNA-processing protein DprA [Defluviitaleaceae bacterium]